MTRLVGNICKHTRVNKENKGAERPGGCFPSFPCVFAHFANNPSHWDGNPGIGIVNPYNPKQSQLEAAAWRRRRSRKVSSTCCQDVILSEARL